MSRLGKLPVARRLRFEDTDAPPGQSTHDAASAGVEAAAPTSNTNPRTAAASPYFRPSAKLTTAAPQSVLKKAVEPLPKSGFSRFVSVGNSPYMTNGAEQIETEGSRSALWSEAKYRVGAYLTPRGSVAYDKTREMYEKLQEQYKSGQWNDEDQSERLAHEDRCREFWNQAVKHVSGGKVGFVRATDPLYPDVKHCMAWMKESAYILNNPFDFQAYDAYCAAEGKLAQA